MSTLSETLARLRVCRDAGQSAPIDLVAAAIECLEPMASRAAQRHKRDALIRRAALLLPRASAYVQAGQLERAARALARRRLTALAPAPATVDDCLKAAAAHAPLPESQQQYYRVLKRAPATQATDILERAMSVHR